MDPVSGDVEGDGAGFVEEYPLEDIDIAAADFLKKVRSLWMYGHDLSRSTGRGR